MLYSFMTSNLYIPFCTWLLNSRVIISQPIAIAVFTCIKSHIHSFVYKYANDNCLFTFSGQKPCSHFSSSHLRICCIRKSRFCHQNVQKSNSSSTLSLLQPFSCVQDVPPNLSVSLLPPLPTDLLELWDYVFHLSKTLLSPVEQCWCFPIDCWALLRSHLCIPACSLLPLHAC